MFFKKIFLASIILCLTISCSTIKSGFGTNEDDELTANVPNYVLFSVNSAKLDFPARNTLDAQAEWLKTNTDINVIVEGHCDERGAREYNLALGAKRASAVKSYLSTSGVSSSRIATISYGKERPTVQGTGSNTWQENRRAITAVN